MMTTCIQPVAIYVRLAEQANGPIPEHRAPNYIWGAAMNEWDRARAGARIINLVTSIARSGGYIPKGINYRTSPENASCLRGAPAILRIAGKGRVVIFSFASAASGAPRGWAATHEAAGVNLLPDFTGRTVEWIAGQAAQLQRPGDLIVASIHWGGNWGYEIPEYQQRFSHALIYQAGVRGIHGHSPRQAKAIEIYKNRLILYGCGGFLNDYEGILGHEDFRGDLAVMYFADFDPRPDTLPASNGCSFGSSALRSFRRGVPVLPGCGKRSIAKAKSSMSA